MGLLSPFPMNTQDKIDAFLLSYVPEADRKMASLDLKLIALAAQREVITELQSE